jgi:hypothetical protein
MQELIRICLFAGAVVLGVLALAPLAEGAPADSVQTGRPSFPTTPT